MASNEIVKSAASVAESQEPAYDIDGLHYCYHDGTTLHVLCKPHITREELRSLDSSASGILANYWRQRAHPDAPLLEELRIPEGQHTHPPIHTRNEILRMLESDEPLRRYWARFLVGSCAEKDNVDEFKNRQEALIQGLMRGSCHACYIPNTCINIAFVWYHDPEHEKTDDISNLLHHGTLQDVVDEIAKCHWLCIGCKRRLVGEEDE